MRSRCLIFTMFLMLLNCINSFAVVPVYSPGDATNYANEWWGVGDIENNQKWKIYNTWHNTNDGTVDNVVRIPISENPDVFRDLPAYTPSRYYNHYIRGHNTDCAHFVTQCLIAGGLRQELHDYILTFPVDHDRNDYAGFIFDSGTNTHNPNAGWYGATINGHKGVVHAYGTDIWNVIVSTRPVGGSVYNGQLSLISFLLHKYHAQYFYHDRPAVLAPGDVFIGDRHSMLIANSAINPSELVYVAHTSDTREGDIDQQITRRGAANCHFFHMAHSVPYVQSILVKQGSRAIYSANWVKDNATARHLEKSIGAIANNSDNISFHIEFDQSVLPIAEGGVAVTLVGSNNQSITIPGGKLNTSRTVWDGLLTKDTIISRGLNGLFTITIAGRNYANNCNQLDGDPKTIAQYHSPALSDGSLFSQYEDEAGHDTHSGGMDKNHSFQIDQGAPYVKDIVISQGMAVKYEAHFDAIVDPASNTTVSLIPDVTKKDPLYIGPAQLSVTFSEPMKTSQWPVIKFNDHEAVTLEGKSIFSNVLDSNNFQTAVLQQNVNILRTLVNSEGNANLNLTISDAKDMFDNPMMKQPYPDLSFTFEQPTMIVALLNGQFHFSDPQPIFTVEFPNAQGGHYNLEAKFLGGGSYGAGQMTISKWNIDYNSADHTFVDNLSNSVTPSMVHAIEDNGRNLLQFSWDGSGRAAQHAYDEDIFIEVKATDEAGNVTVDNSLHFKITPDGIVYDPNDPNRSREQMVAQSANTSNKILFLDSMFSMGGAEFSNTKKLLQDSGIDFRPFGLFGEDKADDDMDVKVQRIKEEVDAFSANAADKITMVAWGEAGLLAKKYLQEYLPTDKVARLVTVSTPLHGINSIPMVAESSAINILLNPVINFISNLGLDNVLNSIQQHAGEYGPDLNFLSFLQKTNRNDLVINPLNFIGLFLKRQDLAKYYQGDSEFMRDLMKFSAEDYGIETSSVTTALWPDMGGLTQVGIIGGFTALATTGIYSGVELFSFNSKAYNNINGEVAELLANMIEGEIYRLVINPIRTYLNDEIRKADQQYLGPLWKKYVEDIIKNNVDVNLAFKPKEKIRSFIKANVRDPIEGKLHEFRTWVYSGVLGKVGNIIDNPIFLKFPKFAFNSLNWRFTSPKYLQKNLPANLWVIN